MTQESINTWMDKEDVSLSLTHTHTHTHTQEYYSAIRKNEIMPFIATWMDLEIIILSGVSQRKTNVICNHLYVESKKIATNGLIYKTEEHSQTQKRNIWLQSENWWSVCAQRLSRVWFSGSSVHGTSQARILERGAISYSRGSSWHVSCISGTLTMSGKGFGRVNSRGAMETWIQILTQHLPVAWTSPLFLVICKTGTDKTEFVYMKQKTQITTV